MPERLPKGIRSEIRRLKSEDREKEALRIRIAAIQQKLKNPWVESLSNSLKSKGIESGVASLDDNRLEAVSEYYLLNVKHHMEGTMQSDFNEQIKEFESKYNDLFPKEDKEENCVHDPFVLSLKYITERFRLKNIKNK
jgi:hypothetical protein